MTPTAAQDLARRLARLAGGWAEVEARARLVRFDVDPGTADRLAARISDPVALADVLAEAPHGTGSAINRLLADAGPLT